MKQRLDRFASNVYSQFGEDGCIAHIFDRIGPGNRVAVEFGAGDGLSCSNTARLWRSESWSWSAVLVESDPARYDLLEASADGRDTICEQALIAPLGPDSIDAVLDRHGIDEVDFMSIDIDGDDYSILEFLEVIPRVICIEFNPTVPPHVSLRQGEVGGTFGASLRSIIELGEQKGYRFVGATYCNAFLVEGSEAGPFDDYLTDPSVLFPPENYTYAVTDFAGRIILVGADLPWGARAPYAEPLIGHPTQAATDDVALICRSFEGLWGQAVYKLLTAFVAPTLAESRALLSRFLDSSPGLVLVDLTNDQPGAEGWMVEQAALCGYRAVWVGRVLALIRDTPPS